MPPLRAEGTMDVEHGAGWLSRPMIWLMNLPAAGLRQQVRVDVDQDGEGVVWVRRIGQSVFTTRQRANRSGLEERSGPGRVSFDLRVEDGALVYRQSSIRIGGLPMPSSLSPDVDAVVRPTTEGWSVVVTVKWRAQIVCRYAGAIHAV
jgi:hypothetical protein